MPRRRLDGFGSDQPSLPSEDSNSFKIHLKDLIEIHALQEMQENFSEVANVAIRTVDAQGNYATEVSNPPSLCGNMDAMQGREALQKLCKGCRPYFLGGDGIVDDDLSFECLPGLRNYLVPLKVRMSATTSLIVGYMILGPIILMKRREKEEFKETARTIGINLDDFWSFLLELRVFSYQGIRSLLDMIGHLTGHILELSYSKLVINRKMLKSLEQQIVPSGASASHLREFLELFLDLVIQVTNGTAGSVMLLDPDKKELMIKAGHGLAYHVLQSAAVKLGDGIAGLAAQTRKSFLINDQTVDATLADRLRRPDLFSSVVAPIKHGDRVYGVVNVSSDRTSRVRFDETTLAFLNRAAGLAGAALGQIQS